MLQPLIETPNERPLIDIPDVPTVDLAPRYGNHPVPANYPKRQRGNAYEHPFAFHAGDDFTEPGIIAIPFQTYATQAADTPPVAATQSNPHLVFTNADMSAYLEEQKRATQAYETMTSTTSEAAHTPVQSSKHISISNEDHNLQLAEVISAALENYKITANVTYFDDDQAWVDRITLSCPENTTLLLLIQKILLDLHGIQTDFNLDGDLLLPTTAENKIGRTNLKLLNSIFCDTSLALDASARSDASPFFDTFLDKLEGCVCFSAAGAGVTKAAYSEMIARTSGALNNSIETPSPNT